MTTTTLDRSGRGKASLLRRVSELAGRIVRGLAPLVTVRETSESSITTLAAQHIVGQRL